MAGPNLELAKFGMYVFFPILVMVHYGDPDWYHKYVLPDRSQFLKLDKMAPSPPRNRSELQQELEHFRNLREERKQKQHYISSSSTDLPQNPSSPSSSQPQSSSQSPETRLV
ncbi:hypothetical protein PTTG_04311 [Puccinia triticina 1-1 BBBD Race 1]|uniref:Uncharacterized protein n=2 Tax=Puccinia triticina TaxID=208348 RepID=A0A0C4EU32_PUCT1|nr:uncharacterized protein PtA15_1A992 [Puccinia triticina]OAV94144.1 hypothetical protein PTTG_04311 [Puccinia triticina 1-1 BBBD Race 1]WAQ81650.1 hypothetical protein PtA15_1A992 [Puccinia triticina]WAR52538.1 hypothetical protein PtB15_1B980 [Puccinia triticina]